MCVSRTSTLAGRCGYSSGCESPRGSSRSLSIRPARDQASGHEDGAGGRLARRAARGDADVDPASGVEPSRLGTCDSGCSEEKLELCSCR